VRRKWSKTQFVERKVDEKTIGTTPYTQMMFASSVRPSVKAIVAAEYSLLKNA
jgi:hypothetical protein